MTLQEIKEVFAKEKGFENWRLLLKSELVVGWHSVDEIVKRYAKAKLEEAAERARECEDAYDIIDSITNTPLD